MINQEARETGENIQLYVKNIMIVRAIHQGIRASWDRNNWDGTQYINGYSREDSYRDIVMYIHLNTIDDIYSSLTNRLKDEIEVPPSTVQRWFEVKYDQKTETGNIAVEVFTTANGNGVYNASGIHTTKSEYWIFLAKDKLQYWVIDIHSLRKLSSKLPNVPAMHPEGSVALVRLIKQKDFEPKCIDFGSDINSINLNKIIN